MPSFLNKRLFRHYFLKISLGLFIIWVIIWISIKLGVSFVRDDDSTFRLISARKATNVERESYENGDSI